MKNIITKTIRNLEQNHMNGYYVSDIQELHILIKSLIPPHSTVGCGDSVTLEDTGVFDLLRNDNYQFLDKHLPSLSSEDKRRIYLQNFSADTFITGTSALTMDGQLFNIDGNGSHVAPMLYGPKQVIIVVGTNKLVEDVGAAIHRVRQISAPLDAKRLGKATPCTKLNECIDCAHPDRICNDFVLISGQFDKDRIKVIIMDGDYGY